MIAMAYVSISITAPSTTEEGATVNASVTVTNVTDYNYSFKGDISAVPDRYPDYVIGEIDQVILAGDSVTEDVSFVMPDCNTTVFISLKRWATDHWAYVGSKSKVVKLKIPEPETYHLDILVPSWAAGGYVTPSSGDYPANERITLTAYPLDGYQFTAWGGDASGTALTYDLLMDSDKYVEAYFEAVPVPEYVGKISKKELEYNETQDTIPVLDVPLNKEGKVHIWGRNDMSTNQKLGIYWIVKDPDGVTVEEYSDWESWPNTDPDKTHEFISPGRFDLDKVGTYTISVGLLMNPDDPLYVDIYYGDLCTVKAIEYSGEIIKKELEYSESGDGTVPVSDVPQGVSAKLHVWGKNDMVTSQGMGIYWFVADPDGEIAEEYEDWGGVIGAGQDHEFISSGSFTLSKVGKYTTWIDLLMGTEDNPVVILSARYIGDLCTVIAELEAVFSELKISSFEKR